jgi:hypothetical protein
VIRHVIRQHDLRPVLIGQLARLCPMTYFNLFVLPKARDNPVLDNQLQGIKVSIQELDNKLRMI